MSLRKLKYIVAMAAGILAAVSCKDDEETTTIVYVDGTLHFNSPEFVLPDEVVKMTPKGLTHPEGGEIGYYWKVTPGMSQYDTTRYLNGLDAIENGKESDGSFTYKFSDTLQTYTVYCYSFAENYTNSSMNTKVTVVKPGPEESITGSGIDTANDPFITVGDNRFYYTTIGGLDWFRQNLAFTEKGVPFRNGEAMNGVFGLFYNYEDAMNACPEGWRLPTDKEWTALCKTINEDVDAEAVHEVIPGVAAKLMTDASFNEVRMWEYWPEVGEITNESGLSMIPTGFANLGDIDASGNYPAASFSGVYSYSAFWTADLVENEPDKAYYRYIYVKQSDMMIGKGDKKTFGASVRCVRNTENK